LFFASQFLTFEKLFGGIGPIAIGKVIYHLVAYTLVIWDIFMKRFSPHQFGVATCGKCETMVCGIQAMLHLHLDWVVLEMDVHNAFNSMSQSTIFQELQSSHGSLY
jgi:hypothetical protein